VGNLAYQRQPGLQTLLVAANLKLGDEASALHHLRMLQDFAPNFVRSAIDGQMILCKQSEHNELLADSLREACRLAS
jgi:hypothetical protein